MRVLAILAAVVAAVVLATSVPRSASNDEPAWAAEARTRGERFDIAVSAAQRVLHAWLKAADPKTLLLPDRIGNARERVYSPHNSGADLYPYLILTAHLTDPDLYRGRLLEMLRNEVRFTTVRGSVPATLDLETGTLGEPRLFGAGEYAKDGLIAVTEYLGRTPWFERMVTMTADAMAQAPVESQFGALPASDAELNGDFLQTLVRLATMTGDPRFLEWARRIGDAYVSEVLPGAWGVPVTEWDFQAHRGERRLRLRDHGNETVVGLVMLFALEGSRDPARAAKYRPVIERMLDRILASANADGMLFNQVDAETLKPADERLSDNWGYVYGAVYSYYLCTGETRYRDAVRRVLTNLPKYRKYAWEPARDRGGPLGSFDGYADAIESAIYLVNREPVPEALDWIESEMQVMLGMQRPDGHFEDWYGEGNFNRTALLYAYMQSQGVRPVRWERGVRVGAVRDGDRLLLHLAMPAARAIRFDVARHRRILAFDRNYVRLNEFPEWFTVDETQLYRARRADGSGEPLLRLGAELAEGIELEPGAWIVEPLGPPPYGQQAVGGRQ